MSLTCKTCGEPFVWHGWTTTTLVGFYSPPGHNHDDNCLNRYYVCANNHSTRVSIQRRCNVEGCDWKGQAECFCHPGTKVQEWPVAEERDVY